MKRAVSIFSASMIGASILLWGAASAASASDFGPRRDRGRARGQQNYSVAEPASIVLLGAGLVGLGLYAKLKRGKKR